MKTIQLLESGAFLLGIESSDIQATFTPRQFQQEFRDRTPRLLPPAGLFLQQQHVATNAESLIVQVSNDIDQPFLLFDRDLATCQGKPVLEFPELYPKKAHACCPEAILHNDEVVLCLDPDNFYDLYASISSSENLLVHVDDFLKAIELLTEEESTMMKQNKASTQTATEKNNTTPNAKKIDPVTQIISWIVGEYDKQAPEGEYVIRIEDIPVELSSQVTLDDAALQYLISQTLTRLHRKQNRK